MKRVRAELQTAMAPHDAYFRLASDPNTPQHLIAPLHEAKANGYWGVAYAEGYECFDAVTLTDPKNPEGPGLVFKLVDAEEFQRFSAIAGVRVESAAPWHRIEHALGSQPACLATARRAQSVLGLAELLIPKRLRNEEVGDAVEVINRIVCDRSCKHPRKMIVLKAVSTCLWLAFNAIREIVSSVLGKKGA